jgi:hypothetical protein
MRPLAILLACLVLGSQPAATGQGIVGHDKFTAQMSEVMSHSSSMIVYSLEAKQASPRQKNFHGWTLLGQADVPLPADRNTIGQRIIDDTGIRNVTFCGFFPHHGVRASYRGRQIDFVICFQCGPIEIFEDGQYWNHGVLERRDLEQQLNGILATNKVLQSKEYLKELKERTAKAAAYKAVPDNADQQK